MLTRQDVEARERRELAPYAAKSAESRGREHPEQEHEYRTAYQRDRDRIVHSTAFRRLEYKTQVFLTHEGDFFRTRLTHTLEVAQIARTLARSLNLNEDLTETVALAHDLGHTPFGHAGEEALRELMAGAGGFEHNRHGVRIIDYLEHPYPQFRGLNLTYEVRECIAKHATAYDESSADGFADGWPPLEGQAVDVADSIAYDSHDLDDALAMGIVSPADLEDLAIFRQAATDFASSLADLSCDQRIRRIAKLLIQLMASDAIETSEQNRRTRGLPPAARVPPLPRRADDHQGQTVPEAHLRGLPDQPGHAAARPSRPGRGRGVGTRHRRLHRRHDRPLRPGRVSAAVRAVRASVATSVPVRRVPSF